MTVFDRFMELTKEFTDIHDAFKELYNEIYRLDPDDFDKALSDFVDLYHSGDISTQPIVEESSQELNQFLAGFEVS